MQGPIAAGLQVKLFISFESSTLIGCHDFIKITSDDDFTYDL